MNGLRGISNNYMLDSGDNNTNLCMTCHQGRESTASVNKAIGELPADTPEPTAPRTRAGSAAAPAAD